MAKRSSRKKRPPVGGEGENTGGTEPSEKESSYARSCQLLKDFEGSFLGWMTRNARWELEKAVHNFVQSLTNLIEEANIPQEHLPVALRDPKVFNERASFFAVRRMAEYSAECLIQGARDPRIKDTEAIEAVYTLAFDACAALRDILMRHSGTDAQRETLARIVKLNSSFPLLIRRHSKANNDAMQALEKIGFGEQSWIHTAPGKKYSVDSELNRYLVRVIPHLQRFCAIDLQGSIMQNSLVALPTFDNCRDPEQAQKAFDEARKLFQTTGKPQKRTAREWAKKVFAPLIEAGFGDPFDEPTVPAISTRKLFGLSASDKEDRSPHERQVHYVFMALKGIVAD
jgi:hypothetical protein